MKKNLYACVCSFATVMSIMMATSSFAGVAGKGINPVPNTTQQTQTTTQQNTITNGNITAQAVEAAGGYIDQAMSQRLFETASAARSRVFKLSDHMNQDIMDASGNYVINDTTLHANSVCQYVAEQRVKELASRNLQLSNGIYTTGSNRPFDMPDNNQELFKYYHDIQNAHDKELEAYSGVDANATKALLLQFPENDMMLNEDFVQGANSAEEAVQMILDASKTEHFMNIYCDNGERYDCFNTMLLNNNFSLAGAAAYNVNGKWYFDIVYDGHRSDLVNELYHLK